jgi:phosphoadenosine phosphosulfate reductase
MSGTSERGDSEQARIILGLLETAGRGDGQTHREEAAHRGWLIPEVEAVAAQRAYVGAPDDLAARVADLNRRLADLPPVERLAHLRQAVDGKIVFTTSFGLEGQVILHFLRSRAFEVDVVTLDTGRLFPETYALWEETERRYGLRIRAIYPQQSSLEALVAAQGINGFYALREARTTCCHVRKVEPLNRALDGAGAWIAGLRADQSTHRQGMGLVTADAERGLVKLSPLFDWTRDAVLKFASENNVPINPLHAKDFVSIGCAPCTRAIAPGEPERAGRWWWEQEEKKECGLHNRPARREGGATAYVKARSFPQNPRPRAKRD